MSTSKLNLEDNLVVKTALSSCNVCVHILLGVIVGIPILYAFKMDFQDTSAPSDILMIHVVLCVLGYQLLMTQALLSQCPFNTWSSGLDKTNRTRGHMILQLLGSTLAITGSILVMVHKDVNFNTTHGVVGLLALLFTSLNLIIGMGALFADHLEKYIPTYVSKLIHVTMGIVAIACASSCLCYGFNKDSFRTWTNDQVTSGVIAITSIFTFIILLNPLINLCRKVIDIVKKFRNRS